MSGFASPPPNYDTRAPGIVACAVVMIIASSLAVILRFWSRAVAARLKFWWDDWAMLATLISSHVFLALSIYWTKVGLGIHAWMIPTTDIAANSVINRVALVFYTTVIWLIKVSALLLYARLFKIERKMVIVLWMVGAVITIWWPITAIVPWTFCHPIRTDVDPMAPGYCDKSTSWFTAQAFINAFLDLVVLLLPMPVVWSMSLSLHRRIVVTLVFLLGYCSAFLSFARFIIIVRNPNILSASTTADPSWDLVPLLYLSMMEGPFAILALCGPSINQLVAKGVKHRSLSSLFTSRQSDIPSSGSEGSTVKRAHGASTSGSSASGQGSNNVNTWNSRSFSETTSNSSTAIGDRFSDGKDDWQAQEIPMGSTNTSLEIEATHS